MASPQFFAQLAKLGTTQCLVARCIVDQLRGPIEILRVDGRQNLRGTELGAQTRYALIERGQAVVSGVDTAGGFKRLQCHVDLPFIQRGLHAREQDLRKALQALLRLAVLRIEQ